VVNSSLTHQSCRACGVKSVHPLLLSGSARSWALPMAVTQQRVAELLREAVAFLMIDGRIADDIPRLVPGGRSDGRTESRTEDPEWDTTRPSVRG